jgi:hypothetical protein
MCSPRVLRHFATLSGAKSAFGGSNLKLAGHRRAPPQPSAYGHLEPLAVLHAHEALAAILFHQLCAGLTANERIGVTKSVPVIKQGWRI